jgi:hypothetical protein
MSKDQLRQYLETALDVPGFDRAAGTQKVSYIQVLQLFIMQQKSIYEGLNMLQANGNILNGYIWSTASKIELETMIRSNGRHAFTTLSSEQ